ncbi:hypothetical protein JOD97_000199 [Duganella sp. 1411]|uniref:hypothetical protein n=1 Tax=Duganella sp. 1411 TaxID=2806572 RepID=UPI001AEAB78B|nr:hypothetical protein [Duganella sp. 1411]MBP1202185.1 hypothetical protein [Duganella sp. 1411]
MHSIAESDWKHLRKLQPVLLDRYCRQILSEVEKAASRHEEAAHPRYLAVCKLIQERDRELGQTFNDMRRSQAFLSILLLRRNGLFTDDEFAGFGDETKDKIAFLQSR